MKATLDCLECIAQQALRAARIATDDPETQRWWTFCMPLQDPIPTRREGEWWADMEELFHTD